MDTCYLKNNKYLDSLEKNDMLVTREEKEQLQKTMSHFKEIADVNSRYSDTLVEMLSFFNALVQELKDKDPQLALRIMNKVTDITKRGIIDEH